MCYSPAWLTPNPTIHHPISDIRYAVWPGKHRHSTNQKKERERKKKEHSCIAWTRHGNILLLWQVIKACLGWCGQLKQGQPPSLTMTKEKESETTISALFSTSMTQLKHDWKAGFKCFHYDHNISESCTRRNTNRLWRVIKPWKSSRHHQWTLSRKSSTRELFHTLVRLLHPKVLACFRSAAIKCV